MATGCESQRWGTLADPRPGRGHGDEIDCVGSMSAEPPASCPTIIFHCRSLPVIPRCGHQICSVLFLWGTWLKKQAETTEGYLSSELGMSRSITDWDSLQLGTPSLLGFQIKTSINQSDHRSRSRVRTSFLYMHCEPQELFLLLLLCQPFYISQVSLFLFSFFSSIVALHKH